jgi:hypothetical protein
MVTHMRLPSSKLLTLAISPALAALALSSSACIVHSEPPPDPDGELSFDWSWDGETSCAEAGVDEVDIAVLSGGEVVLQVEGEPCVGGGLTLTDIPEGFYEVFVDGYARDNVLLYTGSFDIRVDGGEDNYAGLVTFEAVNAAPAPVREGELALYWGFLYPTDNNLLFDCAKAGVDEVDVIVTPLGTQGAPFSDTRACSDDGITISPLPEGRYEVELIGYGRYHDDDVQLYDSGSLVVDVLADSVADLGDVALARVDESFSDFDVSWVFASESCATAGVSEVTLSFTRIGQSDPEDVFAVDCNASNVVRRTFLPGDYVVAATAQGDLDLYVASTTVDLLPNSVAQVDLALAPAP